MEHIFRRARRKKQETEKRSSMAALTRISWQDVRESRVTLVILVIAVLFLDDLLLTIVRKLSSLLNQWQLQPCMSDKVVILGAT